MDTRLIVYVGAHDAVEIPECGVIAVCGEPVAVPLELAGRAPNDEPQLLADGTPNEDYDPGEGLLAQIDNWRVVVEYPTRGSIEDVLGWVADDPTRAADALERERRRDKPRDALVGELERFLRHLAITTMFALAAAAEELEGDEREAFLLEHHEAIALGRAALDQAAPVLEPNEAKSSDAGGIAGDDTESNESAEGD